MQTSKIVLCLIILIGMLQVVNAAPPVLSTVQSGSLEILAPTYNYVTQGEDKNIYWHVFNATQLLTNKTATCYYHLYSQKLKGEHIVTVNNVKTFTNGRDFEVEIAGANFTTVGEYCHLIECNTSSQTGGIERCFTVNVSGNEVVSANIVLITMLLLVIIISGLFFMAFAWFSNDQFLKTIFLVLAGISMVVGIFYGMNVSSDIIPQYANINTIYGAFFYIITIVIIAALMALVIYVMVSTFKRMYRMRGREYDEE